MRAVTLTLFAYGLTICAEAAPIIQSSRSLRRSTHAVEKDPQEGITNITRLVQNRTSDADRLNNSLNTSAFASYFSCHVNPVTCWVNVAKVSAELGSRIVLLFGCSIDIYALDFFCKSANAAVNGFARTAGNTIYAAGNLAYCQIGGLTLAYSFHPGASGPPYYGGCDDVLKTSCAQVHSTQLIQQSVAKVVATFGRSPTAIVVDSSLWDAASWWLQDGKPPEPYVAPPYRVAKWCQQDFPALMHAVQLAAPTSSIAFRTAPRVEFMAGYGHSMENINAMNACYRTSSVGSLMVYKMLDYSYIVEMLIANQGSAPGGTTQTNFFDDAFHPGLLPSMLYIDWVLQWAKEIPVAGR